MLQPILESKLRTMQRILRDMGSVVVAFSGGIDSTLVLKVSYDELGHRAVAVTAVSGTLPERELELSRKVAEEIGAPHRVIETDQLKIPDFVRNDASRCYHCKTDLYSLLGKIREDYPGSAIVNGVHAEDMGDDRPGIQAAREWGVRSPLLEAALTKAEIRELAKELRLSNWDKPAAACLSSRIPRGTPITLESLRRVDRAEAVLADEGFRHVRVRDHNDIARIELSPEDVAVLLTEGRRERVSQALKRLGYRFVTVDLEGYRPGGGAV
ncbi:MAG TPA: ATP-dependent sacrificial sulfur transferase LarE [Nitrospiraceae bacterium]|nr:ATP-dependent sacrificial sulfur transferase LarE [Nitrospiraceae bacterium]